MTDRLKQQRANRRSSVRKPTEESNGYNREVLIGFYGFVPVPSPGSRVFLGNHLKTGHTLSRQNRPTDRTQDMKLLYRADGSSSKSLPISLLGPST